MEIGIQGKNCDFLYGGWINTSKILELMITGGYCLKNKKNIESFKVKKGLVCYDDFESFYQDFINESKKFVHLSLHQMDVYNKLAEDNRPSYLISSMIDDCLEKGRNLNGGGARYHDYGSTPLALPDTIDSLYAIKYAIFDKKICTKEELVEALKNDFKSFQYLQNKLLTIPKYGRDCDDVDLFANKVMKDFSEMYHSYKTRFGGKGNPVILTFIHAPAASSILGARASGLTAQSNISQGITPNSFSMSSGVTAAINSCCKMPFEEFSGGDSSMWDFDSSWIDSNIMECLLRTFIDKKGQIFQGNTTDINELISAQKNPNNFNHLIVRVGGYSARFINLNKELQDEIINRMRHKR